MRQEIPSVTNFNHFANQHSLLISQSFSQSVRNVSQTVSQPPKSVTKFSQSVKQSFCRWVSKSVWLSVYLSAYISPLSVNLSVIQSPRAFNQSLFHSQSVGQSTSPLFCLSLYLSLYSRNIYAVFIPMQWVAISEHKFYMWNYSSPCVKHETYQTVYQAWLSFPFGPDTSFFKWGVHW